VKPEERPLSDLVRQGWEVRHYDALLGSGGMMEHAFHLARQKENKVIVIRRKVMGAGVVAEEFDV
jgi:hypothetical protein